jgi:hypothetical protein
MDASRPRPAQRICEARSVAEQRRSTSFSSGQVRAPEIALQRRPRIGSFDDVRWLAIICLVFLLVPTSQAQQQESSLVDRLLRPNMELQNKAYDKKFVASNAVVERRGTVGTFYLQPNRAEKSFADERAYSAKQYTPRSSNSGSRTVSSSQNRSANLSASIGTSPVHDVRDAYEGHNAVTGRDYADQHQFNARGKSQKSLDRQSPPLTIDQVRELLNKNK